MHEEVNGEDHFTVAFPAVSLGEVYSRQDDHERAIELLDRGVALIESQFGRAHPVYVGMMSRRGDVLRRARRLEEAEAAFRTCLVLVEELPGDQLSLVVSSRIGLAEVLRESDNPEEASTVLEELLKEPGLSEHDATRVQSLLREARSIRESGSE